mgnify:CR=1 FL=1
MGRRKRAHVNMWVIAKNRKEGTAEPPITVKVGKKNHYCSALEICGPSELIYSAHKPLLSCGARLILETTATVILDGEEIVE